MLCFESAKFCLRVTQHSQSKFRWKSKFHWKIRPTYVHCTYIGILKKECRKKMGSLLVHMQLQNSLGFVMVYLRFPPTLSVQTAICITIPIDIHRCQLIGKVIPITQWDQSHFGISLYFWDMIFKIQSKIENLYIVLN